MFLKDSLVIEVNKSFTEITRDAKRVKEVQKSRRHKADYVNVLRINCRNIAFAKGLQSVATKVVLYFIV